MRRSLIPIAMAAGLAVPMLGAPVAHAAAVAYHVDCSAATNGDGTQATPFNTLDSVNALTFGPGDSILFNRGTRCTGSLTAKGSGLSGTPITVDAYGDATLAKPGIDGAGADDAVLLDGVQYWKLSNLDITNTAAAAAPRRGVHVRATDAGTVKGFGFTGLNVHDVTGDDTAGSAGILISALGSASRTNFDDVVVDGTSVATVGGDGIALRSTWNCRAAVGCSTGADWTKSTNVAVRNSTVTGTTLNGITLEVTGGATVEKNTVHGVATTGASSAGIAVANSDGATLQANEVYGNGGGPALQVTEGSDGAVVQYNYTHENSGGFLALGGTSAVTTPTVRYNIGQNDGGRLFQVAGATGAAVYNNSLYLGSSATAKVVEATGSNANTVAMTNNIIDNLGSGGYDFGTAGETGWTWVSNLLHGTHPAGEPADSHKITADPQFSAAGSGGNGITSAGAYKLGQKSPARGLGFPVANGGGRDFFAAALPAANCAVDIGAHQRNPTFLCLPYNEVGNPGFENSTLAPWTAGTTGTATVGTAGKTMGNNAVTLNTLGAMVQQTITLKANTTYTLSGQVRPADWMGDAVRVGVKDFGGTEVFGDNTYPFPMPVSITFTTGATNTTATIYCAKSAGYGAGYCDEMSVNVATA